MTADKMPRRECRNAEVREGPTADPKENRFDGDVEKEDHGRSRGGKEKRKGRSGEACRRGQQGRPGRVTWKFGVPAFLCEPHSHHGGGTSRPRLRVDIKSEPFKVA